MLAVMSYGGLFLGLPLGILPMIQRDDAFALFHAKQSMVIVLQFVLLIVLYMGCFAASFAAFFVTCGMSNFLTVPLLMLFAIFFLLPGVPALHGLILAGNGEMTAPIGTFGLAGLLFGGLECKPTAALPADPEAAE